MGVRATSREAFHSLNDLSRRQEEVYQIIRDYSPVNNLSISHLLHMPINSITPRTNELVEKGLVEESHRGISETTGKRVIFWKLKVNKPEQLSI